MRFQYDWRHFCCNTLWSGKNVQTSCINMLPSCRRVLSVISGCAVKNLQHMIVQLTTHDSTTYNTWQDNLQHMTVQLTTHDSTTYNAWQYNLQHMTVQLTTHDSTTYNTWQYNLQHMTVQLTTHDSTTYNKWQYSWVKRPRKFNN
jgi:hypothetical protein